MRKLFKPTVAFALTFMLASCAMFKGTQGAIRGVELASTLQYLDPLFDHTTNTIEGQWTKFTDEEKEVLERSYRSLIGVRDQVKANIDSGDELAILVDISTVDLLYAQMKDSYIAAREVVFANFDKFTAMEQASLTRFDNRMKTLDMGWQELQKEWDSRDATSEIKEILDTAVSIIQVYRMAKDPLGLTYADRPAAE